MLYNVLNDGGLDVVYLENILMDFNSWGELKLKFSDYIHIIHDEIELNLQLNGVHNQEISCIVNTGDQRLLYSYREDSQEFNVLNRVITFLKRNSHKL